MGFKDVLSETAEWWSPPSGLNKLGVENNECEDCEGGKEILLRIAFGGVE